MGKLRPREAEALAPSPGRPPLALSDFGRPLGLPHPGTACSLLCSFVSLVDVHEGLVTLPTSSGCRARKGTEKGAGGPRCSGDPHRMAMLWGGSMLLAEGTEVVRGAGCAGEDAAH